MTLAITLPSFKCSQRCEENEELQRNIEIFTQYSAVTSRTTCRILLHELTHLLILHNLLLVFGRYMSKFQ